MCSDNSRCPDDCVIVRLPPGRIDAEVKTALDTAVASVSAELCASTNVSRFIGGAKVW